MRALEGRALGIEGDIFGRLFRCGMEALGQEFGEGFIGHLAVVDFDAEVSLMATRMVSPGNS